MTVPRSVSSCRICGNTQLEPVIDLGVQTLTGVFPRDRKEEIPSGPLQLVKCEDEGDDRSCGLVQLKHSYEGSLLYGERYGYRSGLNRSMVEHLRTIAADALRWASPSPGDWVLDIGSNDGTLLGFYPRPGFRLVGMDPTIAAFREYYAEGIEAIADFFSAKLVREHFGKQRAKIITSIAMFYDLEDPVGFVREIAEVLDDQGVWILEQSYMPLMIRMNAYDTICHEHLEYYGVRQVQWILQKVGLKIIDFEINNVNGGSFRLAVAHRSSRHAECAEVLRRSMAEEEVYRPEGARVFEDFRKRVESHRGELLRTLRRIRQDGGKTFGYGASTKGNVILQYCGLTGADLPYIAEVNERKFGAFTPGTRIPIVSEAEAKAMKPDYFLVMPWHFRENIIEREQSYLQSGGCLIFPLPRVEIYPAS